MTSDGKSTPRSLGHAIVASNRRRVERLERRVKILEQLPDRVSALEVQIVQLRDEMRSEFSATRTRDEETRRVLTEQMDSRFEVLSTQMVSLSEVLNRQMASLSEVLNKQMVSLSEVLSKQMVSLSEVLSERMMSLFDTNERHMRVLHEDLVQRIATMRESRS